MFNLNKKASAGFSLTELSIVITIIGMIMSSAISMAITNDFYTKKLETVNKLDRIEEAIAGFVSYNKRLPCVAKGDTPVTASTFGEEGTMTPSTSKVSCPNREFFASSPGVDGGVVPVVTLELPDDYMFDGWGNRITYVVENIFANNSDTNTNCPDSNDDCFIGKISTQASINVFNSAGAPREQQGVYVLLSHGENGHGAFTKVGNATRINGFPTGNPFRDATAMNDEYENSEFTNIGTNGTFDHEFVMQEYIRNDDISASASDREYFDDIVRYKTKQQLVIEAGAASYDKECYRAENIVNNPGVNDCTGAADEDICETYATEVYLRCLQ